MLNFCVVALLVGTAYARYTVPSFIDELTSEDVKGDPSGLIKAYVQSQLNGYAQYWNTSFQVAVVLPDGTEVAVQAGIQNHATGTPMQQDDMIPVGSVTKTFTATGILRLAEQNKLDIDEVVAPLVDPYLKANMNATLVSLFGPKAAKITIHMLLHMSSGLNDYDDGVFRKRTLSGKKDLSPYDVINITNKTLICDPGSCLAYSSVGYELLGLVLVNKLGAQEWSNLDQKSAGVPEAVAAQLKNTAFITHGTCAHFTGGNIVHQYAVNGDKQTETVTFVDIYNDSCVNGWTCGNIAASATDIARFYFDLFRFQIVSLAALANMTKFEPLTTGFAPGLPYGLGLMISGFKPYCNETTLIGHGGEDYGSTSPGPGYNYIYNFSFAITANSVAGMNCSLAGEAFISNFYATSYVQCKIYDTVLQIISGLKAPKIDCDGQALESVQDLKVGTYRCAGSN